MTRLVVSGGYPHFFDSAGNSLEGYLYFGIAYRSANLQQKPVFWDKELTQPVLQPVPVSGGYILRNGTPATVFTDGDYSMLLLNRNRESQYYIPSSSYVDNSISITDSLNSIADLSDKTDMNKGVSLIGGAQRIVPSIAVLRTLPKTGSPHAFVAGYYDQGDGGGGSYYYDASDLTSADDGGAIIVANDGGRWKLILENELSLRQYGAKGDNITNDVTKFNNWFAALGRYAINGFIPTGDYLLSGENIVMDLSITGGYRGVTIRGAGETCSILHVKDTPTETAAVTFRASSATTTGSSLEGFSFYTNINGVGVDIAPPDLETFIFNSSFKNMIFRNDSQGSLNVAARINFVESSLFINTRFYAGGSGQPGIPTAPGIGIAALVRKVHVCTFIGIEMSNARYGIFFGTTGAERTFGSTFSSTVITEVDTCVTIEGANVAENIFTGGSFTGRVIYNCTNGQRNIFDNVTWRAYAGGALYAGTVGLYLRGNSEEGIVNPPFPASGDTVVNTFARRVQVFLGGTSLTSVTITKVRGGSYGIPAIGPGNPNITTIILEPGDSILVVYNATPVSRGWNWSRMS